MIKVAANTVGWARKAPVRRQTSAGEIGWPESGFRAKVSLAPSGVAQLSKLAKHNIVFDPLALMATGCNTGGRSNKPNLFVIIPK